MTGHFYDDTVLDSVAALQTDAANGISQSEAQNRAARLGPNLIAEEEGPSSFDILKGQLLNPIVGVLLVAAILSIILREWIDFGVILAIVILNAVVGYYQEYRAERALQLLRNLAAPKARVIRGGNSMQVAASTLVPGDLIELEPGDMIPADSRIVWASSFRTNESSLTGESLPAEKSTEPCRNKNASLGDRNCCIYVGTSVTGGRARAVVFGTGSDTELGKIVTLVRDAEREQTSLQRDLSQVGKVLLIVCALAIVAVFLAGLLRGIAASDMFLTAVSLAVAAIPEGLPAIVTITLAIGVQRMLKRHVLLRRLSSVETLGCASVICADKTGTITKNELSVRAVSVGDNHSIEIGESNLFAEDPGVRGVLGAAAACSNVRDGNAGTDPTEIAIVQGARRAGWDDTEIDRAYPRISEAPFDSDRRRMSTLHRSRDGGVLFVKGAHEVLLDRCRRVMLQNGEAALDTDKKKVIDARAQEISSRGMRVLAVARRNVHESEFTDNPERLEENLTFLGLIAMADTPRPEVREAVLACANAGIKTVLLTGDHLGTATAIAKEVGIYKSGDRAVTGAELDLMDAAELERSVDKISVYARLAPDQKLKIVRAWKKRGAVVAMTGDGVNDASAIKEADIGVAMGQTGTDVAREAADLVVTDDHFASIVAGVEEGRGVYANIRRALLCLFSGNLSEVALVGAATALGLPVPLHPTQILWMNLVTDGPPALALATEPVSGDEMSRPPRSRNSRLLDGQTIFNAVFQGFVLYLGAMLALVYFYDGGAGGRAASEARMQTGVFCTVVVSQMINCFSFRNDRMSIFTVGLRGNLRLLIAITVSIALQVGIVYFPWARPIFHTQPLSLEDWRAIALFSMLPVTLVELRKFWIRRSAR
ncbi:MAG: cation-translocating P-type ATPase [Planctomycetota bacterium]